MLRHYNCALELRHYNCALELRHYNCALELRHYNCALEFQKPELRHYNCALELRHYNCALESPELRHYNCAPELRHYNCARALELLLCLSYVSFTLRHSVLDYRIVNRHLRRHIFILIFWVWAVFFKLRLMQDYSLYLGSFR